MSVELTRYLMVRNIPTAEWSTDSRQPPMQSARGGQLTVLDLADRASMRSVRASVQLVRGSNFVSETVYPERFNGITQVIQIAYIRTVLYKHTYKRTEHTHIHTRFHFHQSLEHNVIGY